MQYLAKCHIGGKSEIQNCMELYNVTTNIIYSDLYCMYVTDEWMCLNRTDLCDNICKPNMYAKFHCSFHSSELLSYDKMWLFYIFYLWYIYHVIKSLSCLNWEWVIMTCDTVLYIQSKIYRNCLQYMYPYVIFYNIITCIIDDNCIMLLYQLLITIHGVLLLYSSSMFDNPFL